MHQHVGSLVAISLAIGVAVSTGAGIVLWTSFAGGGMSGRSNKQLNSRGFFRLSARSRESE